MRIAVVGGDGYIGHSLVRRLAGREQEVFSLDSDVYERGFRTGTIPAFSATTLSDTLARLEPDCVVWLAAYAHDPAGQISLRAMNQNNAIRPLRCCRPEWRSIFVSSLSTFAPEGAYPTSKRLLESLVFDLPYWRERCRILRFGTIFGPALQGDEASWRGHLLLNSMMMDAVRTGVIHVNGLTIQRPVLSLRHAVDALVEAIEDEGPAGTVRNYFDTSGTLGEYALEISHKVPNTAISSTPASHNRDPRNYGWGSFDRTRINSDLSELLNFCVRNKDRNFPNPFGALYTFVRTHETQDSSFPSTNSDR